MCTCVLVKRPEVLSPPGVEVIGRYNHEDMGFENKSLGEQCHLSIAQSPLQPNVRISLGIRISVITSYWSHLLGQILEERL